ncbi:DUF2459 domain-containing protein [Brevundimonas sp. S30B]|uniref:DUF2459 domain-containing protein n=1 Tax=unclassified Brevundimonas TaxID=2622653 RepID=UPI001071B073|nr:MULTISPECIES: DUF2459 domain-containing protein [unclassified Brevundimonas]QBX36802.1 DUF2459 domain-containing protein [Brevundimonas sp. MF30-B]TFW04403.1 DUF2459 domain-containing protein [Brevundimonas sp. S30B]
MGGGLGRIIGAGLIGLIAGLWTWTLPGDPAVFPSRTDDAPVIVHLLDNGFHTDIAVPRATLQARPGPLGRAVRGLAPGDWVLIGWGDARFYVEQGPIGERLPDGARAFFRPGNPSVVMLDPVQHDPAQLRASEGRRELRLSPGGFDRMAERIERSLALQDGEARPATQRPGDDAAFFASRETFWIGHLCNHWTARVLNAGGVPVRPLRSVTSAEVMRAVGAAAALDTGGRDD